MLIVSWAQSLTNYCGKCSPLPRTEQLSSAAAGLGTEFLWLLNRKLYSGLITVITVIAPIIAPRGHTHYDLHSYHQGAATTAGAQFLLKLACVPLASGPQCPRHRENSVAGHDEAELITSLGDTVILSTLLIQLPVHPHGGLRGQIM